MKTFINSMLISRNDVNNNSQSETRNQNLNSSLPWPVFRSNQPQLLPLDNWKVEIPGPGTYETDSKEIKKEISNKMM